MKKTINLLLVLIFSLGILSSCKKENTDDLAKVTLNLTYVPNVQFSLLYVGIEKGFFAEEGIDLTLTYGNEADMVALVGSDHQQFMIASGEQVLLSREQGLPVISVASWYKDYPVGVVALADHEIKEPKDLIGKSIGLPGLYGANYIGMEALAAQSGLKGEDYKLVSIGFTQVESLVGGAVDAVVVYLSNEPIQLKARGYETDLLAVRDYIELVGNQLVTNENTIKNKPDLVEKMVRAFRKSLEYTANNPEEAWEISKKYVDNLGDDVALIQKEVLRESIELWQIEPETKSAQKIRWNNMMNVLLEIGMMKNEVNIEDVFTDEFLP
jgi:NitT/TauT family transport system substrate-binding protein